VPPTHRTGRIDPACRRQLQAAAVSERRTHPGEHGLAGRARADQGAAEPAARLPPKLEHQLRSRQAEITAWLDHHLDKEDL
jgi:hypothetical protein